MRLKGWICSEPRLLALTEVEKRLDPPEKGKYLSCSVSPSQPINDRLVGFILPGLVFIQLSLRPWSIWTAAGVITSSTRAATC